MNELTYVAIGRILAGEPVSHRTTSILHALTHHYPGRWVYDSAEPSGVLWVRRGDRGGWEAFAAGEPLPALASVMFREKGRPVALLAPGPWEVSIRDLGRRIDTATIKTFMGVDKPRLVNDRSNVRLLDLADGPEVKRLVPPWALRSWGDFGLLVRKGLAVGLPAAEGFASVAWTYESTPGHDKIGVVTLPRYQRLGLARRVVSELLARIINERRKVPIWVTSGENSASIALAKSLGFARPIDETLLRWNL